MKNPKYARAFEVTTDLPDVLDPLMRLAANYRWTWHHETRELFRAIDKDLWNAAEHNPVLFLNRLSQDRIDKLAADSVLLARLNACNEELDEYLTDTTWFDQAFPDARDETKIAYFCAEFGISEGLPIYSGGLGVLAGDHLKAASDLGIPLVAVGLLYNRGYFRQRLTHDGWQQEVYPQYDFYQMPLTLMRNGHDEPLRIEVEFPDRTVTCQVWCAEVGRIKLYLLDSNLMENQPADQGITDTLYGGDDEMRIRQEMILGIGGMRALRALGIKPTVCHMNEGHAAFLSIERIRQFMQDEQVDFRTARQVVVSGNVFTTHTPVPAGFDLFTPELLERYMKKNIDMVGLNFGEFVKLGRLDPENQGERFNMAFLAMEMANHLNGVAKLHAKVSQGMFSARWPNYPESEVPIHAVTNGIHTTTWTGRRMTDLFDSYLGPAWRRLPNNPDVWKGVYDIPDEELWASLENQRGDLVRFIRARLQRDLMRRQVSRPDFAHVNSILDPRILTVGFARRFATYKRATLMVADPERLKSILFHAERPVQIVISGKAHPRDDGGKKLIQDLVNFINHSGSRARMVFLEDYDMEVARHLVQGVDVWLNNPRRPHEASGTSGMKVVPNGGLNCSILDGWWDEGYQKGVGWAIGDRAEHGNEGHQDWLDSRSLYDLLEHEITPIFYHRVEGGIPRGWLNMVRRSITEHAPLFSTNRMVEEYTSRFYMPASKGYLNLKGDHCAKAKGALDWRGRIRSSWSQVGFNSLTDTVGIKSRVGDHFAIRAAVRLGSLAPSDVRVEAVVGRIGPNRDLVNTWTVEMQPVGGEGSETVFEAKVDANLPGHLGYTARIVPNHPDVHVPSELSLVCWAN